MASTNKPRPAPPRTVVAERVALLIDCLGPKNAAELLATTRSQLVRWTTGVEVPTFATAQSIIDLDYVVARACLLWEPAVAKAWLQGSNQTLGGARPIDVLRVRGVTEVHVALDAETQLALG